MNTGMKYVDNCHTYVVCAYGQSRYLERCVRSVLNQTVKSNVVMCTSTPCEYIEAIANKYNLKLKVREGKSDIRDDWNYAISCADTELVTIAHQDDIYNRMYTEYMLRAINRRPDANIFFSGYRPVKNGKITLDINSILRSVLRLPMKVDFMSRSKIIKRSIFAFGNSVCCPTVTYSKRRLGDNIFTTEFKYNIDWDTFLKISNMSGSFAYDSRALVGYRIHDGATSKAFIDNRKRYIEDTKMFEKIWGERIARFIMKFYTKAYDTYN